MRSRAEGFIEVGSLVLVLACSTPSKTAPDGRGGQSANPGGGVTGQGGGPASGGSASPGGGGGVDVGSGGRAGLDAGEDHPGSSGSGGGSGGGGSSGGGGGSGGRAGSGGSSASSDSGSGTSAGDSAGGSTASGGHIGSGGHAGNPGAGGAGGTTTPERDAGTFADVFPVRDWPFPTCTAGTCDDDPTGPSAGTCVADNTCQCAAGFGIDATTGKCARIAGDVASVCGGSVSDCNDTPAIAARAGVCLMSGTCYCLADAVLNPATGRCRFAH